MKFLIAGFGSTGRRHMRNLLALGERDILFYRTSRSTLPTEELDGFTVETNLEAALDHRPDAVIVTNPTALHLDVAIPAAAHGCHILMEKPVAESTERIPALRQALEAGGGSFLAGFQFRFHPGLQQVARWLVDGAIGRPVSARVQWGEYLPGWHPWEDYRASYSARKDLGGGVVLTLCHPFDYLRWFLGDAQDLWAFTARLGDLDLDVEDTAQIGIRFAGGPLAAVHLDYLRQPPTHRLEITGTQGVIRWDNADGVARLWPAGAGGRQTVALPEGFERNDLFMEELRHFIAVVRGEAQPLCTLDDGVRALEISLAALASSQHGEQVHLPRQG